MSRTGTDNSLPNQIRRYRTLRSLRLRDMAEPFNYTEGTHIADWEKGRTVPSLDSALKLSAVLQCPVEILFLERFNEIRHELHLRRKDSENPSK